MHSSSSNIKCTPYSDANNVIDKLFKSPRSRYQENLETSLKGSDFIFSSVELMYYKCYKVIFKHGGSFIDSPDWKKKKKATINPKNTDDKYNNHYKATVALNYEVIESHPERVSNVKPFLNKYDWKGIYHPSKIDDLRFV